MKHFMACLIVFIPVWIAFCMIFVGWIWFLYWVGILHMAEQMYNMFQVGIICWAAATMTMVVCLFSKKLDSVHRWVLHKILKG